MENKKFCDKSRYPNRSIKEVYILQVEAVHFVMNRLDGRSIFFDKFLHQTLKP
jgi:hypothetical protein